MVKLSTLFPEKVVWIFHLRCTEKIITAARGFMKYGNMDYGLDEWVLASIITFMSYLSIHIHFGGGFCHTMSYDMSILWSCIFRHSTPNQPIHPLYVFLSSSGCFNLSEYEWILTQIGCELFSWSWKVINLIQTTYTTNKY